MIKIISTDEEFLVEREKLLQFDLFKNQLADMGELETVSIPFPSQLIQTVFENKSRFKLEHIDILEYLLADKDISIYIPTIENRDYIMKLRDLRPGGDYEKIRESGDISMCFEDNCDFLNLLKVIYSNINLTTIYNDQPIPKVEFMAYQKFCIDPERYLGYFYEHFEIEYTKREFRSFYLGPRSRSDFKHDIRLQHNYPNINMTHLFVKINDTNLNLLIDMYGKNLYNITRLYIMTNDKRCLIDIPSPTRQDRKKTFALIRDADQSVYRIIMEYIIIMTGIDL